MMDRINICDALINANQHLLKRNEIEPFLKCVITDDEKWITYDNRKRQRSWKKDGEPSHAFTKLGLTLKKVMLCMWWDWKGIVHHEVLPVGQTINSQLYYEQLERLRHAIEKKRPELHNTKGVVFHHDNARPHISLTTHKKLREFGWKILMHPPYSPNIAPSDYHLFRSLQYSLNGIKLASKEASASEKSGINTLSVPPYM
nr:histone-lysine N-methyltransferase SETMAR-like [Megalopta genalis]